MKYKVGDKVCIKSLHWYNLHKDASGRVESTGLGFIRSMSKYCDTVMTISCVDMDFYRMEEDRGLYCWSDSMIKGFAEEGLTEEEFIDQVFSLCEETDMVNSPSHYIHGSMECIDAIEGAYGKAETKIFCKISAFKSLWKLGHKDEESQEIGKAKWYLDKYLELSK